MCSRLLKFFAYLLRLLVSPSISWLSLAMPAAFVQWREMVGLLMTQSEAAGGCKTCVGSERLNY